MEDGLLNSSVMKTVCVGICVVSLITAIVLVILGFSSLEATQYGLDYSWISKTIDPTVKQNGLYFLGIGHSFIRFPKNVQTIEFSNDRTGNRKPLESRTSDGLEVIIEISFQYVLLPEKIFTLYNSYGDNYPYVLQNIAIDVLTDQATKYTAYDFFMDRGKIKDDFHYNLNKAFTDICFSTIEFLQLRSVGLPSLFEQSIQDSEVKKQDIQKAIAELNKVKIEVDTKIKSAEFQKNVTINNAEGDAGAIFKENTAQIDALKKVQLSQSDAYAILKGKLGMNNKDLNTYIKTKLVKNYNGNDMALNLNTPEPQAK